MTGVIGSEVSQSPDHWSDTRLVAELRRLMAERVRNTDELARVYVAAVARNLCQKLPLDGWLRLVAAGTLRGSLVEAFHGKDWLLRELAQLPLAEQDAAYAGRQYEFVEEDDVRSVSAYAMHPFEVAQVFVSGRVRSADEQRKLLARLERKPHRPAEREPDLRRYTPTMDREKGQMVVNRMAVPLDRVLDALASGKPDRPPPIDMRGDELAKAGCETVGLILWREELAALQKASRSTGLPTNELIRKAVRAYLGDILDRHGE